MKKYILTSTLAALLTLGGFSAPALAGPEDVVVENAWSRASIGMNRPGAAYMTIRNTGDEPVTLTGLATPLAMMPEIHESKTNADGVSSMAPADEIARTSPALSTRSTARIQCSGIPKRCEASVMKPA